MSEPAHSPLEGGFTAGLRARLDLVEPEPAHELSPELVLVDPELRSRLGELPTGPEIVVPPPTARVEHPSTREHTYSGGSFLASAACICAFVLALPVLAIAADLVRANRPRLVPEQRPASGRVHVGLEQHVRSHPPGLELLKGDRPG